MDKMNRNPYNNLVFLSSLVIGSLGLLVGLARARPRRLDIEMSRLKIIHYIRRPDDTFTFCHRAIYGIIRRRIVMPAPKDTLRVSQKLDASGKVGSWSVRDET